MLGLPCSDRIVAFISNILWTCPGFSGNSTSKAYRNSSATLMGESRTYQKVTRIPNVAPEWSMINQAQRLGNALSSVWKVFHVFVLFGLPCQVNLRFLLNIMRYVKWQKQNATKFFFQTLSASCLPDPCIALTLLCEREGGISSYIILLQDHSQTNGYMPMRR